MFVLKYLPIPATFSNFCSSENDIKITAQAPFATVDSLLTQSLHAIEGYSFFSSVHGAVKEPLTRSSSRFFTARWTWCLKCRLLRCWWRTFPPVRPECWNQWRRLSSCQEDIFQWRVLNYNFKHFFSETLIASQVALAEPGHNVEAEQQWSAILQRSNKAPGSLVY